MKKVLISHFEHRGSNCLSLKFAYDEEIVKLIKPFGALYSKTYLCWYVVFEKSILEKVTELLKHKAIIEYHPPGQIIPTIKQRPINKSTFNLFADYCSLFISYSFKDQDFVKRLNELFLGKGIKTFLWEKDAPYGNSLSDIMFENVNKYDKVLFVSSENSLKSEACHFELSQARLRNDKLWKNIIFPIHIDNFLFNVRKEQIRPLDKQDEYWKNILELRQIHSADFSIFVNNYSNEEFIPAFRKVLKDLEK